MGSAAPAATSGPATAAWQGSARKVIVSGKDVLASIGVIGWSGPTPAPGFPHTHGDFWCGSFRDEFDWSTLPLDYLRRIGAMRAGELREKPRMPRARSA